MNRLQRFAASQLIWLLTLAFLFLNLDWLRFSNNPFPIMAAAVGVAFLVNLGIWFGEGIVRAFNDDLYETLASGNQKSATDDMEKRKRDRIDKVLRDLSDDDLLMLRQRLEDGVIDDDVLYEGMVGDDGEFLIGDRSK